MDRNRLRGMLWGVAVGDALGAPHEFRNQVSLDKYTGRVAHRISHNSRYQGLSVSALGQVTDDTEMTLALARSLCTPHGNRYSADDAVMAYIAWANSGCKSMGKNTRELFKGIKTLRGYQARAAKKEEDPEEKRTQSNGCLMRCSPLAILPGWETAAREDCALTNPHPTCIDSCRVYVGALVDCSRAIEPHGILKRAIDRAQEEEVVDVLQQVRRKEERKVDEKSTKGWTLHALYCAFWAAVHHDSYEDAIDEVILRGGDTDTNAAIAGALLGARLGFDAMNAEARTSSNIAMMLLCETENGDMPRPREYQPRHALDALAGKLLSGATAPAAVARARQDGPA